MSLTLLTEPSIANYNGIVGLAHGYNYKFNIHTDIIFAIPLTYTQ